MRRMGFLPWLSQNWFLLIEGIGIIGGLLYTGLGFWKDVKERRISNTLAITQAHHELWAPYYKRPELARVVDPSADVVATPVTLKEETFVLELLVHLQTSREVSPARTESATEAVHRDIRRVFSLPIPRAVWEKEKALQDREFVEFMEAVLNS